MNKSPFGDQFSALFIDQRRIFYLHKFVVTGLVFEVWDSKILVTTIKSVSGHFAAQDQAC